MMDNLNLLTDPTLEPSAPNGWRFVGAVETALGRIAQDADGAALIIEHAEHAEGSRWEQTVTDLPTGTLLTFTGHVQMRGPFLRSLAEGRSVSVSRLTLEALADNGVSLGTVDSVFPFPLDPRGTFLEANSECELGMIVSDGTDTVRASAALSGSGAVSFSSLTLTSEIVDRDRMNDRLVDRMKAAGALRSPTVESAFRAVPRHHFLPDQNLGTAYRDDAIVTHFADGSQEAISSSSQPTMMAIMLEQLQLEQGMRVLEIGAGTGYNAALLAKLTGDPALVWTLDVTEEFCAEARAHLRAANVEGVHVIHTDGWAGWPEATPYDRIIVTANAHDIAPAWLDQLKNEGRLVVPWGAPNAPQRSLTFRRDGERLIMEGQTVCSFMRMRGAQELPPPPKAASETQDDWLFPGQPAGDPTRLVAYPVGAAPAPGAGESVVERRWFAYLASWGGG